MTMRELAPVVVGCDPGLANLGYAAIMRDKRDQLVILDLGVIVTKKQDKKKVLIETRANVDDQKRMKELFDTVNGVFEKHRPKVLGVESYAPSGPNSNGWKAALAYGMVCGMARTRGIGILVHIPQDLKRKIASKLSASKEEVQKALETIFGCEELFAAMKKGDREHAADALGHAYLALLEMEQLAEQVKGFV